MKLTLLSGLATAALLCGCSKPAAPANIAPAPGPVAKYEFESFTWPAGSVGAKVIFYTVADETTTNGNPQWSDWMRLQEVLSRAQYFDWEYLGTIGDTCLLRRPACKTPTDPAALTGRFAVKIDVEARGK